MVHVDLRTKAESQISGIKEPLLNVHPCTKAEHIGMWYSNLSKVKPIWMDVFLDSACQHDVTRSDTGYGLYYFDQSTTESDILRAF